MTRPTTAPLAVRHGLANRYQNTSANIIRRRIIGGAKSGYHGMITFRPFNAPTATQRLADGQWKRYLIRLLLPRLRQAPQLWLEPSSTPLPQAFSAQTPAPRHPRLQAPVHRQERRIQTVPCETERRFLRDLSESGFRRRQSCVTQGAGHSHSHKTEAD